MKKMLFYLMLVFITSFAVAADKLVFESQSGPGKNKHVVVITGDEEYRSEESGPMLAKILNKRYDFKTSVLFAINPETEELEVLASCGLSMSYVHKGPILKDKSIN